MTADQHRSPSSTIGDEHFAEQFPLSPLDDYLIHQTPDPIRVMWSSDPRAYERYWMVCHDDGGEVLVATGLQLLPEPRPGRGLRHRQPPRPPRTVRGFRRLGADRMDLRIGPDQPDDRRRACAGGGSSSSPTSGASASSCDFRDTTRQVFREPRRHSTAASPGAPARRDHRVRELRRGRGLGRGRRAPGCELAAGIGRGTRDRHWGDRAGRGRTGPGARGPAARRRVGQQLRGLPQLDDLGRQGLLPLRRPAPRRPGGSSGSNRRLRFEPDTHIFVEGHRRLHARRRARSSSSTTSASATRPPTCAAACTAAPRTAASTRAATTATTCWSRATSTT